IEVRQEVEDRFARIRTIRSERIDPMQADLDGVAGTARSLAERVATDRNGQSAGDVVSELVRRLDEAQQVAAASTELQTRLDRSKAELEGAQKRQLSVQASLAPLMSDAGVSDIGPLGNAIERSGQRREVERKLLSAETEMIQSADGLPLEEL